MHCNVMGPLGYSVTIGVIEARAEIPVVDDEGITCPEDLLCHLVNQVDKGTPQNLKGNRV